MNTSRKEMYIPALTLKVLIGEGSINPAAFRRSRIERFWPCGCLADYGFDKVDDVRWMPCRTHEPSLPSSEGGDE